MKVISVWQPYASLAVNGFKFFETRGWPAPRSIIGQTIGIASTKTITPYQREILQDPEFQTFYAETLIEQTIEELPHGFLLGTAVVDSCELIDEDLMESVTKEELAFGWWEPGRYAWRLRYARAFPDPIPVQGKQGIWNWDGDTVPRRPQSFDGSNVVSFPL